MKTALCSFSPPIPPSKKKECSLFKPRSRAHSYAGTHQCTLLSNFPLKASSRAEIGVLKRAMDCKPGKLETWINKQTSGSPGHLYCKGDGDLTPDEFVARPNVCVSKEGFSFPSHLKYSILKSEKPFHLHGYHGNKLILMSFPCGSSFQNKMIPRHIQLHSIKESAEKWERIKLICSC